MCNSNIENLEIENKGIWDYCFECGTPLSEDMQEDKDWFNIRNNGESFPICKECKEKAEVEVEYSCIYCGEWFKSQEVRDEHQKTCEENDDEICKPEKAERGELDKEGEEV